VLSLGEIGDAADPILGLDRRPADNRLYAVSRSGRVFIVDIEGAVNPSAMVTEIQEILIGASPTPLPAGRISTDFNPAANALRIIGDNGLNLRVPTMALANPAPVPPVDTLVDGIMGYRQGVTAAAYTNPHPDTMATPATELFVIDAENDALYLQNANAGELRFIADLSVPIDSVNGYDIFQGAADADNEHFVSAVVEGEARVYGLDPADGTMTLLVSRSTVDEARGLIVVANEAPFAPPLRALLLDSENGVDVIRSFAFNRTPIDLTGTPISTLEIVGLAQGERIVGIDLRTTSRVNGREDVIYAVTNLNRVLALLEGSGNSLVVADATTLSTPLAGNTFGVDFNPAADLLRIVSNTGQNLRVNLQQGRELGGEARQPGFALVDGTTRVVEPDPGTDLVTKLPPQVVATAYRAAPMPDASNFQFVLDAENNALAKVVVPNDGALELVGPLGGGLMLPRNATDAPEQSLDISGPNDSLVLAALLPEGATRSALYSINLQTGEATLIGSIGSASSGPVSAITVRFE